MQDSICFHYRDGGNVQYPFFHDSVIVEGARQFFCRAENPTRHVGQSYLSPSAAHYSDRFGHFAVAREGGVNHAYLASNSHTATPEDVEQIIRAVFLLLERMPNAPDILGVPVRRRAEYSREAHSPRVHFSSREIVIYSVESGGFSLLRGFDELDSTNLS
jgi:hypothetical protein